MLTPYSGRMTLMVMEAFIPDIFKIKSLFYKKPVPHISLPREQCRPVSMARNQYKATEIRSTAILPSK
jgi:hypothetical protein